MSTPDTAPLRVIRLGDDCRVTFAGGAVRIEGPEENSDSRIAVELSGDALADLARAYRRGANGE